MEFVVDLKVVGYVGVVFGKGGIKKCIFVCVDEDCIDEFIEIDFKIILN